MQVDKRARYFLVLLIIFLSVLVGLTRLSQGHNWGGDFAGYIMQAESLLDGSVDAFLAKNKMMVELSDVRFAPVAYPWGYPILLIPILKFWGAHIFGMKLLNLLFYALFLWVLFLFFQRHFSFWENLTFLLFFAFNARLLSFSNFVISDFAFLFFSALSLLLIDSYHDSSSRHWQGFLVGGSIFVAFWIRTNGILLLPALFLVDLLDYYKRRFFQAVRVLPYLTFFVLWGISAFLLPSGEGSHFSFYQDVNRLVIWNNLRYYFTIARAFLGNAPQALGTYYLLLFFALIGGFYRYKEDIHLIAYFLLTLGLYISWPSRQGDRFLLPILPLFIYFSFYGTTYFFRMLEKKFQYSRVIYVVFLFLFLYPSLTFGVNSLKNLPTPLISKTVMPGPYGAASLEMFDFLIESTPEDSMIVFFKPRVMRFITGRNSFIGTECSSLANGDYLVLNRKRGDGEQLSYKQLKSCSFILDEIFISEDFLVYQIPDIQ